MSEISAMEVLVDREIGIFVIRGYLGEKTGLEMLEKVEELLDQQISLFAFDLNNCTVLSSQGVGFLLEIAEKVVGEFQGKIGFCGLDQTQFKVLNFIGVIGLTNVANSLDEAKKLLLD